MSDDKKDTILPKNGDFGQSNGQSDARARAIELATTLVETQAARPDLTYSRLGLAGELLVSNQLLAEAKRVDELEAECERLRGEAVLQQIHYSDKLKEQRDTLRAQNEKLMAAVDAALLWCDRLDEHPSFRLEMVRRALSTAKDSAPPATPYECEHF